MQEVLAMWSPSTFAPLSVGLQHGNNVWTTLDEHVERVIQWAPSSCLDTLACTVLEASNANSQCVIKMHKPNANKCMVIEFNADT